MGYDTCLCQHMPAPTSWAQRAICICWTPLELGCLIHPICIAFNHQSLLLRVACEADSISGTLDSFNESLCSSAVDVIP